MNPPQISRRKFLENAGLGAAGFVGAGLLAACAPNGGDETTPEGADGESPDATATTEELLTLTTPAFWIASANFPWFATVERQELDIQHGVDWDMEWTTSLEDVLTAVAAGRADFTPNNTILRGAQFALEDAPVKITGTTFRIGEFMVCRSGNAIEEWGEIRGSSLAIPQASIFYAYALALSRSAGFELEEEVDVRNIPFGQTTTEVQAGNVDYGLDNELGCSYFLAQNPDEFEAAYSVEKGIEEMLGLGPTPTAVSMCTEDLLGQQPDAAHRINDTNWEFEQIWENQPDEMAALLAEPENPASPADGGLEMDEEAARRCLRGEMSERYGQGRQYIARDFREYLDGFMQILELLNETGFLDSVPPAEDMFWMDGPEYEVPA